MGKQRTFASVAWSAKGKVTRRERFVAEMDAVIPWPRLPDIAQVVDVRIVEGDELRRFDPELRSFFDINTREDYQQALRLAGFK